MRRERRAARKIILVAGARPNFMKVAPLWKELIGHPSQFQPILLHTGQHYDYEMSKAFFEDLDLPEPHYALGAGSGTHAEQTAKIMVEFEKILPKENPDLVVVFGDVNSTLACSITAKKLSIPVAHVEAGLRSHDMDMPEEINRKVTDSISDFLFTPSRDGDENLVKEGISASRIFFVGNIMIDSLLAIVKGMGRSFGDEVLQKFDLQKRDFSLVTLHRPTNVDQPEHLLPILNFLNQLSERLPVLFPVHPRTKKSIQGIYKLFKNRRSLKIVDPLRYREFISLEMNSKFVFTDSGGIQEETTYFMKPCLTLRPNTERPITLTEGTNELVTLDTAEERIDAILSGNWKKSKIPVYWDGQTAKRICGVLSQMEL